MEFPDKVTITVTQDDINNGTQCSSFRCPGALAGNRAFPGYRTEFGTTSFGVQEVGPLPVAVDLATYMLDEDGKKFVRGFDSTLPPEPPVVEPCTFTATKIEFEFLEV